MKRVIITMGAVFITLVGCDEKTPPINFLPAVTAVDTTYVESPAPAPQDHNVLIEDFTGASCSNCPNAHRIIKQLDSIYNTTSVHRVNAVSLHYFDPNFSQTEPHKNATYDFRATEAKLLADNIYGPISSIPIGGIDRMPYAGSITPYQIGRSDWSADVATRLASIDSVNLDISSRFNATTGKATIKVKIAYPYTTSSLQNLSIVVVEDGFIDYQHDDELWDTFYHFNDIFRGYISAAPFGDPILPAMPEKEKGRVYERTYIYEPKSTWKPANCRIIAFVHKDASNGAHIVYQTKQCNMIQ